MVGDVAVIQMAVFSEQSAEFMSVVQDLREEHPASVIDLRKTPAA